MTRAQAVVLLAYSCVVACTSVTAPVSVSDVDAGAGVIEASEAEASDGLALPALPGSDTLCRIVLGASSRDEIESVLGPSRGGLETPNHDTLLYDFAGGVMILLHVDFDIFREASVYGARYPRCWAEQEQALKDAAFEEAMRPDAGRDEQRDGAI